MPKTPKAAFLTTDYPPGYGGLQAYSHRIADELPGEVLGWVDASSAPDSQPPRPRSDTIQYRFHRGQSRLGALAWSVGAVLSHCARGRARTFLHMQWSTALGSWLLRVFGVRIRYVVLAHGAELLDPGSPLNPIKRRVLGKAAMVVAGSRATANVLRDLGVHPGRLRVLPYGCRIEGLPAAPAPPLSQGLRLACLHRLVPRKGTRLLLEALAGLRERDWTLDIAGEGGEKAWLEQKVRLAGMSGRIRFLPPVAEAGKAAFLRGHHLFILPSLPPGPGDNYMEGLGIGLLEAQACGLAVLAAATGGIPEAVHDGQTGLLFEPGNVEDLRLKLLRFFDQPELAGRLGAPGPAWVAENFSWEKTLTGLAEILANPD